MNGYTCCLYFTSHLAADELSIRGAVNNSSDNRLSSDGLDNRFSDDLGHGLGGDGLNDGFSSENGGANNGLSVLALSDAASEDGSFTDDVTADDLSGLDLVAKRSSIGIVDDLAGTVEVASVKSTNGSTNHLASDKLTSVVVSLFEGVLSLASQEVQEVLSFFRSFELYLSLRVVVEDTAGGAFSDGDDGTGSITGSIDLVDRGESQVEGVLDSTSFVVFELLFNDQQTVGVGSQDGAGGSTAEESTDLDGIPFSGDESASSGVKST